MKKILFTVILICCCLGLEVPAQAQRQYRGFVEGGIGGASLVHAPNLGFMLSTTHGFQWNKNFFGIGVGITPTYCRVGELQLQFNLNPNPNINPYTHLNPEKKDHLKISLPLYANWRYDFFGSETFNYFVGLKAGVNLLLNSTCKANYKWDDTQIPIEYNLNDEAGIVFLALNLGLRKRISSSSGLSFGISIQTNRTYDWMYASGVKQENGPINSRYGLNNVYDDIDLTVLATVGFDF